MALTEIRDDVYLLSGKIGSGHDWGGDADHLEVDGDEVCPLAAQFNKSFVSVRYWVSDIEISLETAIEASVMIALGFVEQRFIVHGSDVTGYLWTDEDFIIGGHDMIAEIRHHKGKYLLMEITSHPPKES